MRSDGKVTKSELAAALKLDAARVNAYWLARGHMVNASVAYRNGVNGWPSIVSDTLNGLPKKR